MHSAFLTLSPNASSGDLMVPPDAEKGASKKKKTTIVGKGMKAKTIRQGGKGDDDSSDEDDW